MTGQRDRVVADECAADERYRTAVRRDDRHRPAVHHGGGNAGRAAQAVAGPAPAGCGLVGRVALAEPTDFFEGTQYYIGTRYLDDGGVGLPVFSWTTPIARTFYQGHGRHELSSRVAATRTMVRRGGARITDYADDPGPAPSAGEPFEARALSIKPAPARRRRPVHPDAAATPTTPAVPEQRTSSSMASAQPEPAQKPLRAEHAVRAAVAAPRQERLSSVLSTLQADQYELVTADPTTPLLVQGHPGTGKTIVAAHRAAYIVHPDTPRSGRVGRVLVVGPTEHHERHISGVLTDLVEDLNAVEAMSLERVMLDIRGVADGTIDGGPAREIPDVSPGLAQLTRRAADLQRQARRIGPRTPHADGVREVYVALQAGRVDSSPITANPAWLTYLRRLPEYRVARRARRHLPLLAACGLAVAEVGPYTFDHVIVDEAQDVTALEWWLLRQINPSGSWTLLGDTNQRRSDLSCRTWDDVRTAAGVRGARVETLACGYRTSAAIMRFAGRLLPPAERSLVSLQTGGEAPRVDRVRSGELNHRACREAMGMLGRHPEGTVAVISTNPREIERTLRLARFTIDPHDPSRLIGPSGAIRILDPQDARGLEFDAVVVVEPGAFPTRFGRHGLLYTSLTRANRELTVVHSCALPEELRGQAPRPQAPTRPASPAQRSPKRLAIRRRSRATGR